MKIYSIVFLLGVCSIYFFSHLPPLWPWVVAVGVCIAVILAERTERGDPRFFSIKNFKNLGFPASLCSAENDNKHGFRFVLRLAGIIAIFLLGIIYVIFRSQQTLSWSLPEKYISNAVTIEGTIASIPIPQDHALSFLFSIQKFNDQPANTRVRLSWYTNNKDPVPDLQAGDRWRFVVRLKPPHNLANPGSFDSEKFFFAHGIRAAGYVVTSQPFELIENKSTSHWVDRIRQKILGHMQKDLEGKPYAAFIYALTIGEKYAITGAQWQVFQNTGTNHLMAIAGLHIGFIAGLVFLVVNFCWRRIPGAALRIPTPPIAAIASLLSAIVYSALAGFDIPTQRAIVMLGVFLIGILFRRYIPAWQSIAGALILVLLWNPLSVLEVGFWLSFGAVSLLAYGLSARFNTNTLWWKHGRTQWVVSLGLIPLTLLFFSNASLVSPLANSIAIPWVGFITVPLSLLGGLLSLVWPWAAHYVLITAEWTLHGIWEILSFLAARPESAWQHISQNFWFIFPAMFGFLLLLAPRGVPNRWLGIFFMAPMLWAAPPRPANNELWFTLLDVGQGLSAVVQTHQHTLIFDTGAKYSDNYDMGKAVVIPFLRYHGIDKIDKLIISHGDNDHIGGAQSILSAFQVKKIETSVPERFLPLQVNTCLRGEQWQWNGVDFKFLYPAKDNLGLDNDSSCVLKISFGGQQILLTGDIEKTAENNLLMHAEELASSIIIAPHHGSTTSSTADFLAAVQPQIVLFPVGYLNRFGFPKPEIITRYQLLGVKMYDTATQGAISIKLHETEVLPQVSVFRGQAKYVWNS